MRPGKYRHAASRHGALPEKPMMPRLFDEHVGYFTATVDYSRGKYKTERTVYCPLAPGKDPAAISEPEAYRVL
jgi:hypothetical protein